MIESNPGIFCRILSLSVWSNSLGERQILALVEFPSEPWTIYRPERKCGNENVMDPMPITRHPKKKKEYNYYYLILPKKQRSYRKYYSIFAFTHIPIPSQTGIWRLEPRYETKITVMTFPISYMEAMIPDIELGIS